MKTMFNMMKVLHTMIKVGRIKLKVFPTHKRFKTWVYEGNSYQNLKLKSQTIEVLHHVFLKENPTNLLGKKGKFKKEIVKLITLGRNK
jgi:hypothetical protein